MIKLLQNSTLNGIMQIMASLYWVLHFGRLMYWYHFTDMAFYFMYPNWTLVLFISMGLLGIFVGVSVMQKRYNIKTGYLTLIGLFVIGLIIDLIVVS